MHEQLPLALPGGPDDIPDIKEYVGTQLGYAHAEMAYAENVREAASLYLQRKDRRVHPKGKWDSEGRWFPSASEMQSCCTGLAQPTREFPYGLMKHCRTLPHICNLKGVRAADVRNYIRTGGVLESADPDDIDFEAYAKGQDEFGFIKDPESDWKILITFKGQPVDWLVGEDQARALVPDYNELNRTKPYEPRDWQSVNDWFFAEKYGKAPRGWSRKYGSPPPSSPHYVPTRRSGRQRARRLRESDPDDFDPKQFIDQGVKTYTLIGAEMFNAYAVVTNAIYQYAHDPKWAMSLMTEGWPGIPEEVARAVLTNSPAARLVQRGNDAIVYYQKHADIPRNRKGRR